MKIATIIHLSLYAAYVTVAVCTWRLYSEKAKRAESSTEKIAIFLELIAYFMLLLITAEPLK